jgi:hypothetical protein
VPLKTEDDFFSDGESDLIVVRLLGDDFVPLDIILGYRLNKKRSAYTVAYNTTFQNECAPFPIVLMSASILIFCGPEKTNKKSINFATYNLQSGKQSKKVYLPTSDPCAFMDSMDNPHFHQGKVTIGCRTKPRVILIYDVEWISENGTTYFVLTNPITVDFRSSAPMFFTTINDLLVIGDTFTIIMYRVRESYQTPHRNRVYTHPKGAARNSQCLPWWNTRDQMIIDVCLPKVGLAAVRISYLPKRGIIPRRNSFTEKLDVIFESSVRVVGSGRMWAYSFRTAYGDGTLQHVVRFPGDNAEIKTNLRHVNLYTTREFTKLM